VPVDQDLALELALDDVGDRSRQAEQQRALRLAEDDDELASLDVQVDTVQNPGTIGLVAKPDLMGADDRQLGGSPSVLA